jgi:hypothetical protein
VIQTFLLLAAFGFELCMPCIDDDDDDAAYLIKSACLPQLHSIQNRFSTLR